MVAVTLDMNAQPATVKTRCLAALRSGALLVYCFAMTLAGDRRRLFAQLAATAVLPLVADAVFDAAAPAAVASAATCALDTTVVVAQALPSLTGCHRHPWS